ncbi:hypothetical protein, partial [Xanthomonas euvesicatoria]|uniref:hypothetical protein n=1 Tax=Xanthomonas euvesicatoria TaxID=456327 RepID=UPI00081D6B60
SGNAMPFLLEHTALPARTGRPATYSGASASVTQVTWRAPQMSITDHRCARASALHAVFCIFDLAGMHA